MLYDVERARAQWQTQGGHTETIFGCQFHPDNPNLLATCSYDSTVRLWDVTTQQSVQSFVGAQVCRPPCHPLAPARAPAPLLHCLLFEKHEKGCNVLWMNMSYGFISLFHGT